VIEGTPDGAGSITESLRALSRRMAPSRAFFMRHVQRLTLEIEEREFLNSSYF
jgi:hypothetical protein